VKSSTKNARQIGKWKMIPISGRDRSMLLQPTDALRKSNSPTRIRAICNSPGGIGRASSHGNAGTGGMDCSVSDELRSLKLARQHSVWHFSASVGEIFDLSNEEGIHILQGTKSMNAGSLQIYERMVFL
jgi:hypothetical protein